MSGPPDSVGVVGLGIMGSAMSANLARAGIATRGYDVLEERRGAAARNGVEAVASIAALAERSPIVLTSLPSADALLEVA